MRGGGGGGEAGRGRCFASPSPRPPGEPRRPKRRPPSAEELLPNMDEGRPPLPEQEGYIGPAYPSLYMCKPKRGVKRDESKETYKLPHRLIEKKRRDRINECIAQLKDLLPEHLKLTTLGHLEKAVVLELTLKHLKALTALTEQQHQKIIALQHGERSLKSDREAFHSGFQTCTKEVLQYLSRFESWTPREQRCAQLLSHLHSVCTQFLPSPQLLASKICGGKDAFPSSSTSSCGQRDHTGPKLEGQSNCVPVIQGTQKASGRHKFCPPLAGGAELGGENDTDTDSGYGGECEGRLEGDKRQGFKLRIKQEPSGEEPPPAAKRLKPDCSSASSAVLSPEQAGAGSGLLSSLVAFGGSPFAQPPAAPFCLPLCFISPSAAAAFLDKSNLEKYLYPAAAAPLPWICQGIPAQAAAAAAAAVATAFPCFSSVLVPGEKACLASAGSTDVAYSSQRLSIHLPATQLSSVGTGASLPKSSICSLQRRVLE